MLVVLISTHPPVIVFAFGCAEHLFWVIQSTASQSSISSFDHFYRMGRNAMTVFYHVEAVSAVHQFHTALRLLLSPFHRNIVAMGEQQQLFQRSTLIQMD